MNLTIFDADHEEYLRNGPFGLDAHEKTRQRVRNVPGRKVKQLLAAVPPFLPGDFRRAWSHWMAVSCGRHLWPDANHRTSYYVFSSVMRSAVGTPVTMAAAQLHEMGVRSKALRDPHKLDTGRFFTVKELADAGHPYRRLFAEYEAFLELEEV